MSLQFNLAVERWLNRQGVETGEQGPLTVLSVTAHGSDMAGDTESGFHDDFGVSIQYQRTDDRRQTMNVTGKLMQSLWEAVTS